MITAIIVWGSLLAAVGFSVAYCVSPRLRSQVEQPKYRFQQQAQDFEIAGRKRENQVEVSNE